MPESPYAYWHEVPVCYSQCDTDEKKLKQRIRRAFEKAHDHGFGVGDDHHEEQLAQMLFDKLSGTITSMIV